MYPKVPARGVMVNAAAARALENMVVVSSLVVVGPLIICCNIDEAHERRAGVVSIDSKSIRSTSHRLLSFGHHQFYKINNFEKASA